MESSQKRYESSKNCFEKKRKKKEEERRRKKKKEEERKRKKIIAAYGSLLFQWTRFLQERVCEK